MLAAMPTIPWFEILAAAYIVWVAGASITLLTQRRSPTATLAWLLAFFALPVVSGLYYIVFGPRRMRRRTLRYGIARKSLAAEVTHYLRSSCCQSPPPLAPEAVAIAGVIQRLGQGGPTFASRVDLLEDGDACTAAIEEAIGQARHHVHCEYYIWEPDRVGTRIRDALVAAARRGVQVRALRDALGSSNAGHAFWAPLVEAGGAVRAFNPVGLSIASLNFANFRTHRKIVVVDGAIGLMGGNNLHDAVSAAARGDEAWRDVHVRIEGEPVRRLQRLVLEDWLYAGGDLTNDLESIKRYFPPAGTAAGQPVQVLASGPDDDDAPLHAFFLAALSTARTRAWIQTPYLIPDQPLESALRVAVLRGVDVQVIVPRKGDSRVVSAASRTYCDALSRAGVRVLEFGPPMLHAKTMVIDDTVAVVGTANLDNRSFRLNFEVAAAFYDPAVISRLARRFEEDRARAGVFSRRRREGSRIAALLESLARLSSPVL
jgi:cardiolipin synthase